MQSLPFVPEPRPDEIVSVADIEDVSGWLLVSFESLEGRVTERRQPGCS